MKFRTELRLKKSNISISYSDRILMLGSCFAENVGKKLLEIKYPTTVNPLGIIYHPLPLHTSIINAIDGKHMNQEDLNINIDGQYTAWNIHSRLSTLDLQKTLSQMNQGINTLKTSISNATHIFLTYGTAYYYNHKDHGPVANCHKFPSNNFEKRLSTPSELITSFEHVLSSIKMVNPTIKVHLTVSPVRHIKDGIVENNRSKAHLITAVHDICDRHENCQYLPSYELLLDDLRDYRYYKDDMVHPTAKAIDYIWSKIIDHLLNHAEATLRSDILKLVRAASHRPFNSGSEQHKSFLTSQISLVDKILASHPNLDFSEEMKIFKK